MSHYKAKEPEIFARKRGRVVQSICSGQSEFRTWCRSLNPSVSEGSQPKLPPAVLPRISPRWAFRDRPLSCPYGKMSAIRYEKCDNNPFMYALKFLSFPDQKNAACHERTNLYRRVNRHPGSEAGKNPPQLPPPNLHMASNHDPRPGSSRSSSRLVSAPYTSRDVSVRDQFTSSGRTPNDVLRGADNLIKRVRNRWLKGMFKLFRDDKEPYIRRIGGVEIG